MRGARIAVIVACAGLAGGCDLVFGADVPRDGAGPASDAHVGPDAGPADARPPDGPPGDRDGDGIDDGIDNCPDDPNSSQRDEDEDGFGDACDRCIGLFDNQADTDDDHVGDACDLFPATPGTVILRRYFVDGGATPGELFVGSGAWPSDADTLSQTQSDLDDANIMVNATLPHTGHVWIEVGVVPTTLGNGGNDVAIGAWIDADTEIASPARGHHCGLHANGAGIDLELVARGGGGGDVPVATTGASQGISTGTPIHLVGHRSMDGFHCVEPGPGPTEVSSVEAARSTTFRFGLHTRFAAADFGYIIIYHQPP